MEGVGVGVVAVVVGVIDVGVGVVVVGGCSARHERKAKGVVV